MEKMAILLKVVMMLGLLLVTACQPSPALEPTSVEVEKKVTLLVNSFHTNQVLRYNAETGAFIEVFVSEGLNGPNYLIFGPDGDLYISNHGADSVGRYDGQTGKFMDVFVTEGGGGLVTPASLVFGPDGHLYVSGFRSDNVVRYDGKTGEFIDVFISPGAGGLKGATGLLFSKR